MDFSKKLDHVVQRFAKHRESLIWKHALLVTILQGNAFSLKTEKTSS